MPITGYPQSLKERLQKQTRSEFLIRPLQGVRQDRSAPLRERTASPQASPVVGAARARKVDINSDRVKKHSTKRQTVQAIGWVKRPISDEINRIAAHTGESRSSTIATLLEEAVHQRLHIQHAVMLSPLVRKAVLRGIQGLLPLLVSIAYDSNQTRHLTGNVLAKHTKIDELDQIRERTAKKAKDSILHQRPQIEELVEVANNWFAALEQEGEADPA
jgi:hypothetical protein